MAAKKSDKRRPARRKTAQKPRSKTRRRTAPRTARRRARPSKSGKKRATTPRRATARRARKPAKPARKAPRRTRKPPRKTAGPARPAIRAAKSKPRRSRQHPPAAGPRRTERPALDRDRRILSDAERLGTPRTRPDERMLSAARSGHNELVAEMQLHTEASPTLTAGDLDARWQDAYAVGDEAPGGDNPTPDQDRVDDIGKALGIQYQDDQELMGGDEVTERDKHRWELDPASSDDWPHDRPRGKE